MTHPLHVPFLTVEDNDDLIVSFALGDYGQNSLTLLRTPKYEPILDEHERGVSLGASEGDAEEPEMLVSLQWSRDLVEIESTVRRYRLDIAAVDAAEVEDAKIVLGKMNFDGRFKLVIV